MGSRNLRSLQRYLHSIFPGSKIERILEIGAPSRKEIKRFGYGKPYQIDLFFRGKKISLVLSSIKPSQFGHEFFSDRAQILLWQHSAFNRLPKHARSIDVGFFTRGGELRSAGDAKEFFILMEKVEGKPYYLDLERIKSDGIREIDEGRVVALSSYLAKIHSKKRKEPGLYIRRARELIASGECIYGLIDSYPESYQKTMLEVEKLCTGWRWKLKKYTHRLSLVHGDFHPWNVLFLSGTRFRVLDRSRGEWGEPADDVSSMTINYILYSLLKYGKLAGEFKKLFDIFFQNYLNMTKDEEILKVIQPFYAFRGLVVASPIWYPFHPEGVREKLFAFIKNVLSAERFEPGRVNKALR